MPESQQPQELSSWGTNVPYGEAGEFVCRRLGHHFRALILPLGSRHSPVPLGLGRGRGRSGWLATIADGCVLAKNSQVVEKTVPVSGAAGSEFFRPQFPFP
jgi:hypothetical protein